MRCSYKPQANGLWSMWYCLMILVVTGYLSYLGVRRYLAFNDYDWPNGTHMHIYSVISVALHGFALVLTPFFIAACCFKVGNLASDGERLGDRTKKVVDVLVGTPLCRKLKSAWQHGPPVAQTIHLSMAFALLMAHTLMETQFFKHHQESSSILKTEEIWTTDLEFLYRPQDDKLTQLMRERSKSQAEAMDPDVEGVRQQQNYPLSMSSNFHGSIDYERDRSALLDTDRYSDNAVSSMDIAPKLLPLLSNFRLYGMSLLFINYLVALLVYASVYPSVYWRVSKAFSFVFSCHLFLHAVASIFGFIGFLLLYRYQVANEGTRPPFILNEYLLLAVYVASCTILFFASSVVYGYGYNKFCLRLLTAVAGGRGRLLRLRGPKTYPVCCEGYSPHIAAILMLILMVAAKAPLLYDQMILYQKHFKTITLVCIIVDVAYLFAWILLWLALTLKREWAFRVRYTNAEIGVLLGVQTDEGRPITNSTLMVMCGDDYFATDDESKRTAILQLAEKCGLGQHEEEVYWLKPSHVTSGGGNAENQQNTGAPEMNNLLGGSTNTGTVQRSYQQQTVLHHTHQPPHTKAATIGVSGGNYYKRYGVGGNNGGGVTTSTLAYSKVSFSDGEDASYLQKQQQQQLQQQRFAQTRASGSYVRFSDDQSAVGLSYDDHAAQDIVSTFGTLPRGQDYPRRRILQDNEGDFFAASVKPQPTSHVQTLASVGALKRTPSPLIPVQPQGEMGEPGPGMVTYASVHKRSSSPGFRTAEYGRIIQHPQAQSVVAGIGDTSTDSQNVSRVSSYANIPASSKQNWEASSLNKPDAVGRPPTGRPLPHPGNGHQQPQQYHHHQHHYSMAGSAGASPQPYGTLPHPTSIASVPPGNNGTPNTQTRRQMGYKPAPGAETVAFQPRASPKHSPSLEPEGYHNGVNGQTRKLTSFSNSSSASGGVGGESSDTTPTQQHFGGLLAPGGNGNPGAMTASASSSSREMTPLSNASGSLSRVPGANKTGMPQPVASNWHSNPIYGQAAPTNRSYTPQSNYGSLTPTTPANAAGPAGANHIGEHGKYGAVGIVEPVYYNGAPRPAGVRPLPGAPMDSAGASSTAGGARTLLGLESHDRNDSANFSLTSSNESDNNQFVTSIV